MASSQHPSSFPPKFGRFQVIKELGRGGMGSVYLAQDPALKRNVAIKVIDGDAGLKLRERFSREGEALAKLSHPSILRIHEIGQSDLGLPYIVVEYLEGQSFDTLQTDQHSFEDLIRFYHQFAEALEYAHSQGILHRDVKPSNLFLCKSGRVVLLDFGLARFEDSVKHITLTEENEIVGTPSYMAPEQVDGQRATQATDVYGLGASLFFSLTGRAPYVANNSMKILMSILSEAPPTLRSINPTVPANLELLTLQALTKDPSVRPTSSQFKNALLNWKDLGPHRKVPWLAIAVGVGFAVLILIGLSFASFQSSSNDGKTTWIKLKIASDKTTVWRGAVKLRRESTGEDWLLEIPDGTRELSIRRDGATLSVRLPKEIEDYNAAVQTTFNIQLSTAKDMTVSIEDRRGNRIGPPTSKNTLELGLGRYTFVASQPQCHDSVKTIEINRDRELVFQCRSELLFDAEFQSSNAWAPPLIQDVNGDEIQDILVTGIDQRRGVPAANAAFVFAISGKDGRALWTFDQFACRWARPALGFLKSKPCLAVSKLSRLNKPEIAFLEPHSGEIISTVAFSAERSPGQPVYCELSDGPGAFVAMVGGVYQVIMPGDRAFTLEPKMYEAKYGSFSQIAPLVMDAQTNGFQDCFVLALDESTHVFQVTPTRPYGYIRIWNWTFEKPEIQTQRAMLRVFPEDQSRLLEIRTGKVNLRKVRAYLSIRDVKRRKLSIFTVPGAVHGLLLFDLLGRGASQIIVSVGSDNKRSTLSVFEQSGESLVSRTFNDVVDNIAAFTDKNKKNYIVISERERGVVSILEGQTLRTVWRRKIGKSTRIAVADLDNNGVKEIIAISRFGKKLFVYDPFLK
ncbi:MAG: serine/threonine-protein kinase [Planctomycetota bacterium]|nr:serine/threonine-protein kinase [Planctomycetota bacterium]